MPKNPKRPCRYPGCPNLCESGTYCPEHSAESPDRLRGNATKRGYDAKLAQGTQAIFAKASLVCKLPVQRYSDARDGGRPHRPASWRPTAFLG